MTISICDNKRVMVGMILIIFLCKKILVSIQGGYGDFFQLIPLSGFFVSEFYLLFCDPDFKGGVSLAVRDDNWTHLQRIPVKMIHNGQDKNPQNGYGVRHIQFPLKLTGMGTGIGTLVPTPSISVQYIFIYNFFNYYIHMYACKFY